MSAYVDVEVREGKLLVGMGDERAPSFRPATTADNPPQANDAKCGLGCHTIVQKSDYVFTDYGRR